MKALEWQRIEHKPHRRGINWSEDYRAFVGTAELQVARTRYGKWFWNVLDQAGHLCEETTAAEAKQFAEKQFRDRVRELFALLYEVDE